MLKKKRCKAKDGHICDSEEEKLIDDFLHQNGIEHKKVPMQWALSQYFYENSFQFPDWIIHGEFVEYLGLNGVKDYDSKVERKLNSTKKGKDYHFLLPYRHVFAGKSAVIHVDKAGNIEHHNTDYRTYLLKRFRKNANVKLAEFVQ